MRLRVFLALVMSVALMASTTTHASAQDEVKEPDDTVSPGLGQPVAATVLPGVETSGFNNTYVLTDSADDGGPTFNSPAYNPATVSTVSNGDDVFQQVNIGFAFEFYDLAYANLFISSNGALTFTAGDTSFTSVDLSTSTFFDVPTIFAFLDDLAPFNGGDVLYGTFGSPGSRVFVVEYRDIPTLAAAPSNGTFQVRLFEGSNAIEFHYFDLEFGNTHDFGASATVGIRNGGLGTAYLQYLNESAQIGDGTAIRLWRATCGGLPATIIGDRGNETLTAAAVGADDVFYGHHGNDIMNGQGGNDQFCGGYGDDTLNGGDQIDFMWGGPGEDTFNGGLSIDRMWGDDGDDTMDGGGGSDRMWGGDGNDTMLGDSGADRMFGGPGNDTMNGMGGQDFMWGEAGNDVMQGTHQSDNLFGGPGNDMLFGAGGKDSLFGEGGNDTLSGGDNTDYLNGGAGVDTANGGRGRDRPLTAPKIRASNGQFYGGSGCIAETILNCQTSP